MNQFGAGPILDNWTNSSSVSDIEPSADHYDYLISTMTKSTSQSNTNSDKDAPPFYSEAYRNYKEQVNNVRTKSTDELVELIMKLGWRLDQQLDKIIGQLDVILGEENDHDK